MVPIKPSRLHEGDTVAVLSPSWGGPSLYPHVFDLGIDNLKEIFKVQVKEYPTARMYNDQVYRSPQLRAEDLNRAFRDPEVNAIIASIGGDDSVRILPFLDMDSIVANPKIVMGFSDTTTITSYLNANGLVTFNGPSIMAGFAQLRHLPPECTSHIKHMLFDLFDSLEYRPYPQWTNQYVSWKTPGYAGEVDTLQDNSEGWRWLQGEGAWRGRLFGGCIEVFEFLKGTRFWPDEGFFKEKILFFETSEEKPTVSNVKYMLRNYGSMGIFHEIRGIMLGRARSYSDLEKAELEAMAVQIVAGEFGVSDIPIVANVDFGHTEPQLIMPLGAEVELDCASRTIKLTECPTA